jgi:hypothetical protein
LGSLLPRRIDEVRRYAWGMDSALAEQRPELIPVESCLLKPGKTLADLDIFEVRGMAPAMVVALSAYSAQEAPHPETLRQVCLQGGAVGLRSGGEHITDPVALFDALTTRCTPQIQMALSSVIWALSTGGDPDRRPFRPQSPANGAPDSGPAVWLDMHCVPEGESLRDIPDTGGLGDPENPASA